MKQVNSLLSPLGLLGLAAALICGQSQALGQGLPLHLNTPFQSQGRSWGGLQFLGPDTLADVAASVAPSVVNVEVMFDNSIPRQPVKGKKGQTWRSYPEGHDSSNASRGTGSGIILKSDGIILTSNHVVDGAYRINVTLQGGRTFAAEVLGADKFSDLAVLKIDSQDLRPVTFGSVERTRPGDWVLAIGSPLGLDHTVTLGIVSALNREAKGLTTFGARSGAVRFIQTDAAINPGNSGGPLVNLKGEVIGINTFIHGNAQNIGFAIPCDLAQDVADRLIKFRTISHPFIGIVMADLDEGVLQAEGLPAGSQGVLVRSVYPRSPAFRAGVFVGDLIVEADDKAVRRSDDVSDAVRVHNPGETVKLRIRHDGKDRYVRVPVEQLPEDSGS
jgi:S1-C subfamily serine protease